MDLALSDEQEALVDSFAELLRRESSPDRVRAAEPDGFDPALWRKLVDGGVVTMAVPEESGGWGASVVDLALVAEQIGRALASAPVIETQVAARLLAATGTKSARTELEAVLGGSQLVTMALGECCHGVTALVPAGAICDAVVVFDGARLRAVPVADPDRHPLANLGSAPLADVPLTGGTDLGTSAAQELFEAAVDEWLVLTAAALVGMSAAAHEATCAYAVERHAFGGPIGRYQGVAHPLAEDATRIDGARLLTLKAAWALDLGDARARELAGLAFAFASETAERATYDAIHFHGGYGFMLEHDLQLYYRRVRAWARVWGSAEDGYRRAATARYGPSVAVA